MAPDHETNIQILDLKQILAVHLTEPHREPRGRPLRGTSNVRTVEEPQAKLKLFSGGLDPEDEMVVVIATYIE
jgi:hypothetical protein